MWSIQQSVQNGQFLGRLLRMRWRSYCAPPAGGIIAAMANAFGLVLDSASVRRAAVEGVPETVIGTIYLLHENSVDDISSKLTPHELGHVIRLVGRCPGCYPPGTLAALKSVRLTRLPDPSAVSISTDQARSRLAARTSAERLHRHRPHARKRVGRPFEHSGSATAAAMHISGMPNPYGIKLDDASIRWATASACPRQS